MMPRNRHQSGLTLLELMLALAITGVIGLGVATMLLATSQGTASRTDLRAAVVKHKTLTGRFDASVRGSTMVLAHGSNYLVLWTGDTNGDGLPRLSELRRVEWNTTANANTIVSYKAPSTLAAASDTAYALSDNFATITSALKGTSNFPAEVWATGISGWTVTLNHATAANATLVRYRFVTTSSEVSDDIVGAAALRGL
jgi:prepilin-type N-terminal cleavage/methylation domain-containing protein